jgi:hypothetical protein
MIRFLLMTLAVAITVPLISATEARAEMKARFADDAWNGRKIPDGQWCTKFAGEGATPALTIRGVPDAADAIVIAFNDESFGPMNNGGHGVLGFTIGPDRPVALPSAPGETNDLPAGITIIQGHKAAAAGYSPGTAYLPPCSGGIGNKYTATIKAVTMTGDASYDTLQEVKLKLGKY